MALSWRKCREEPDSVRFQTPALFSPIAARSGPSRLLAACISLLLRLVRQRRDTKVAQTSGQSADFGRLESPPGRSPRNLAGFASAGNFIGAVQVIQARKPEWKGGKSPLVCQVARR